MCPTAVHWGSFVLCKLFHCHSLGQLCITQVFHCCSQNGLTSSQVPTASHLSVSMSFWLSNGHLPGRFCVVPTAIHCCVSESSHLFHFSYVWWLCIISRTPLSSLEQFSIVTGVPLPFTSVALHCFKCLTAAHWCGFVSSQMFHCFLLWWPCIISGVSFSLIGGGGNLPCFRYTAFIYLCGFALSQVSHCNLLVWLCVMLSVFLLLTWLGLCCLRCLTAAHYGGFSSSQMYHCCSLRQLSIILDFLQWFAGVHLQWHSMCLTASSIHGYDCSRHATVFHWGNFKCSTSLDFGCSLLSQVSHCCSVEWF